MLPASAVQSSQISQTELGELAGVSRQTISLIERKKTEPAVILALKLVKIFHVPVGDIFEIQKYAKGKRNENKND